MKFDDQIIIREANQVDFEAVWLIFSEIVSKGDTYALATNTTQAQAKSIWLKNTDQAFVAEKNNKIMATYYIKKNQAGPGSHVCNCGYMVAEKFCGMGLATRMCHHSQAVAIELGYKAMQFNFVASSNEAAIALWLKLGYQTVGRLPRAFNHPTLGLIDSLVMYKWLEPT